MTRILFDFDETIISHKVWSPRRNRNIAKLLGLTYEEYVEIHENYKSDLKRPEDFTAEDLTKYVGKILDKDTSIMLEEYFNEKIMKTSLFEDVIPVLKYFYQKDIRMGIYSAGNYDFQYKRVKLSGILKYMKEELIFIDKDKDLKGYIKDLPRSLVVDDKVSIVNKLAKYPHIKAVLINRSDRSFDLDDNAIQIKTLLELKEIIK